MAVRPIDANALHTVISAWPESIMYKDWVQSAIATAPTLTPPNEWVSVEERLPNPGEKVLVYIPKRDGCCQSGCFIAKRAPIKPDPKDKRNFWGLPTYGSEYWTVCAWGYFEEPVITHWMPLPTPPNV